MNRFDVRIHGSLESNSLQLQDLERKLVRYLNRKKAQEPVVVNGATNYILRNGLAVNLYSRNGNGILEMLVVGDIHKFGRSIEAVMRIYKGYIEISYL